MKKKDDGWRKGANGIEFKVVGHNGKVVKEPRPEERKSIEDILDKYRKKEG